MSTFIVVRGDDGGAMRLYRGKWPDGDDFGGGVLFAHGKIATEFQSRKAARNAIRRTLAYADRNQYDWRHWRFDVVRLVPQKADK